MYQIIIFAGNVGADPTLRYTPEGQAVTSLSVATSRKWTDKAGRKVDETVWFRVSVWGKQAESCNEYLHKGSKVLVEGRLTADPATGGPRTFIRPDGTAGASFEVTANTVRFLSAASETAGDDEGF